MPSLESYIASFGELPNVIKELNGEIKATEATVVDVKVGDKISIRSLSNGYPVLDARKSYVVKEVYPDSVLIEGSGYSQVISTNKIRRVINND